MTSLSVYVECEPFFNMLAAAVETFKRECLGVVFGLFPTPNKNFFKITNVLPLQCTRVRKNKEVEQSKKSDKVLKNFFSEVSAIYPRLGHFHSHPEWGALQGRAELSIADINDMVTKKSALDFLIVISSRHKGFSSWKAQEDGGVKGSLGHFNFHINAYTLEADIEGSPIPKKLPIIANAALKALNNAHHSL